MKCAVITPVGPGHENDYAVCLQTIEMAWAHGRGPFEAVEVLPMWDLEAEHGRSARRNSGIDRALEKGCEWIFFLDADDLMNMSAFEDMAKYHEKYDAVWGNICETIYGSQQIGVRDGQLPKTEAFSDILKFDPSLTLQMGHFVRARCAAEIRFDTTMDTGEDFKYYIGLWERFRCAKVEEIFFINQRGHHSSGPRSADGRQWRDAVQKVICDAIARHGLVTDVHLDGKAAHFAITNPFDIIQAHQCNGMFFEQGELAGLKELVGTGKTIVEVGANIGNHVVFYAQHMDAARIYPFEPNPDSVVLLEKNIALNGLDGVIDRRGIGYGVGKESGQFSVYVPQENNLGTARLVEGGDIPVVTLDSAMAGIKVDFIKIDVEGMEFEVLEGARQLIAENRPLMYVEVWNDRIPVFEAWLRHNDYKVIATARCVNAVNALVGPA
jgi:FkbM family methyltransferase